MDVPDRARGLRRLHAGRLAYLYAAAAGGLLLARAPDPSQAIAAVAVLAVSVAAALIGEAAPAPRRRSLVGLVFSLAALAGLPAFGYGIALLPCVLLARHSRPWEAAESRR